MSEKSISNNERVVLNVSEVASKLNCEESEVVSLIESGALYAVKLGAGNYRISDNILDNLLNGNGGTRIHEQRKERNRAENEQNRLEVQTKESYSHHHTYLDAMFEDFTEKDEEEMAVAASMGKVRNHGDGSVFWSESRQEWRAQFTLRKEGMPPKRKLLTGFKTESEARRQMVLVQSLERGEITIPAFEETRAKPVVHDVLFADHINDYLRGIVNKGSSRAMKDKMRLLGILERKLGHLRLGELNKQVLQSFLDEFAATPSDKGELYSQSYINKLYDNTNCCIRDARENGKMIGNPMEFIKKPESQKPYKEEEPKDLTDDEIRMILAALEAKPMLLTLVLIMLHTGIRPEEAYALKYSDFNFNKKTVCIKRALSYKVDIDLETRRSYNSRVEIKILKNERVGKRNYAARRVIKVSDGVLNAVGKLWEAIHNDLEQVAKREANNHHEYLFTHPKDGKLMQPDYYLREYSKGLREHGIDSSKYNMYRTRHTFCTWCFRILKLTPKEVAYLMGDSSMDMVMRVYQSVSKEDTLENSGKYSEIMSDAIAG